MDGNNPVNNKRQYTKRYFVKTLKPPQFLALGFLLLIIIGTLLLNLPVSRNPGVEVVFIDALFTAASSVCVTGLTVVDTANSFNTFGQIVIMLLMQLGGLGFMTMAVVTALFFGRRIDIRERRVIKETMGHALSQGVSKVIWNIVRVTIVIELIGALFLSMAWLKHYGARAFYLGLFHSISAFNNVGIDLMGDFRSMSPFTEEPIILIILTLLVFLGGIGYPVIGEILSYHKRHKLSVNTKLSLIVTFILLTATFLGILVFESGNTATLGSLGFKDRVLNAVFYSVVPRTAGFSTVSSVGLTQSSLFLFMIMMLIGASPGSTGGGIKTNTIAVVLASRWAAIRGKKNLVLFKRRVDSDTILRADTIFVLYIILVCAATMVLTVTEDFPLMQALFEVVSAAATVGFSTGITPDLSSAGKITIILTMYIGKIGPLTLAYAVAKGKRQLYDYPREDIILS